MTAFKITLVVTAFLIMGILYFFAYIGLFSKIIVKVKETGPFVLVYEDHIGDYKETGKIQDKIYYSLLNEHKIETFKGFGIYYDNPKTVSIDKLRSIAGCILEESDHDKIDYLKEAGFKVKSLPANNSVVAEFPFKNNFSIIAGIMKVYPKIEKFISDNNLVFNEMMEIYNVPSKKINYLVMQDK